MADRWESVLYTVLSKDTKYHTYRVKNTSTGQETVVQWNLMLQDNFLPLEVENNAEAFSNQPESNCDSAVRAPEQTLASERTASWVAEASSLNGPSESLHSIEADVEQPLDSEDFRSEADHSQSSVPK